MAVPAHDGRDFDFAKKYNLEIRQSVAPYFKDDPREDKETEKRDLINVIVKNPKNNTYLCLKWKTTDWQSFPGGGTDGEELIKAARREVAEETGYINIKFIKQIGIPFMLNFTDRIKIQMFLPISNIFFSSWKMKKEMKLKTKKKAA